MNPSVPARRALLVVSFGTSHQDTCEKNIAAIERDLAAAFPDRAVRRAFTSGMILKKLRVRDGLHIDCVREAMERLITDGFDDLLVQPTHVLNGEEYDDIVADIAPYRDRFQRFALGTPLLTSGEDYHALCGIIDRAFPPEAGTALCLMGHGSTHMADAAYAALDYRFKDMGRDDVFVGTVEGYPDFDTLLRQVKRKGCASVVLTPLMVVAGDHAVNDMASDDEDSWKSAFEAEGYAVCCVLRGLGEYPEVRALYVAHARAALEAAMPNHERDR